MRRRTLFHAAVLIIATAAPAIAQEKPSFAGKWTQIADATTPAGSTPVMTITQDAKTLTIEYISQRTSQPVKLVYNLDGTPAKQAIGGGEIVSTSAWEGNKLVTTIGTPPKTAQMILSLEGDTLVFETRDPGQTQTVRRAYKKTH